VFERSIADRRPRVLVVEDERHVRSMLCDLLAVWGIDADQAPSAVEGLARLQGDPYDVLLTDVRMPGMDGLELVARARERDAALGVIVLTGSPGDFASARERLGFTLLRKPLDLAGFRAALTQTLGQAFR
jgi:two-component system response regulator AauR